MIDIMGVSLTLKQNQKDRERLRKHLKEYCADFSLN